VEGLHIHFILLILHQMFCFWRQLQGAITIDCVTLAESGQLLQHAFMARLHLYLKPPYLARCWLKYFVTWTACWLRL